MTRTEIAAVLKLHAEWLADLSKGARANLHAEWLADAHKGARANLRDADLSYADLRGADLSYADLSYANLRYANLSYADLRYANLRDADLSDANLRYANLRYANWGVPLPDQIERLDAVREIILAKPERLHMADWHQGGWTPEHTPEEEHSCGSAHCIAGWLQALSPDIAVRQMDPLNAGITLAPIAAGHFYDDDDDVLAWFKDRKYADATEVHA